MPKKTLRKIELKESDLAIAKDETIAVESVLEACGNDLDLARFFAEWCANGHNATEAYIKIYPNVTYGSARTLGARLLAKVDKRTLMAVYGLTPDMYFQQLHDGAQATMWNDFTGKEVPDHKTRKAYHDKLGKHLEYESESATLPGQININNIVGSWAGVNNADTKS